MSPPQAETYYASPSVRVRCLRLDTSSPLYEETEPETGTGNTAGDTPVATPHSRLGPALQWIAISPGATLTLRNSPQVVLPPGELYQASAGARYAFQAVNLGAETPPEVLEIRWETVPPAEQMPASHVTERRPWGGFTVLADEPHFKLKHLFVLPGNRLSHQRHQKREEHWFVIGGHPEITVNDTISNNKTGDYIKIPYHAWHRLANPAGNSDLVEIIELQLGQYFGEDDIERRDDDYGRA